MPIIETQNPWANAMLALAGEAQGYQGAQQQRFQNQLQQQQAAQQALQQQAEAEYRDKQLKLQAGEYGLDPNTMQPLPSNVKYDPMPTNPKPGELAQWASTQLAKAVAANDVAGVSRFKDAALSLSQTDVREEGTIPLDKARVSQIQDYVKNHYKQQFDLLMARGDMQMKLRASAAYRKAGGGSGSGEREAIALATAINAANREEYSQANQNARDQVRQDIEFYEKTYNPTTGQGYNLQTGGMSATPPSTTVNVAPPIIYNGGMVPYDPTSGRPTQGGGGTTTVKKSTPQLAALFGSALQNGHTAQDLRAQAAAEGYTQQQINSAFLYLAAHKGTAAPQAQGF